MQYRSQVKRQAEALPGVEYTISKMSFGRRIDLMRRVRELSQKMEFHQAGGDAKEHVEAALLAAEIDRLYLEWGLVEVEGLAIDGEPANARTVVERGPEALVKEILGAIKAECGLTEEERKN